MSARLSILAFRALKHGVQRASALAGRQGAQLDERSGWSEIDAHAHRGATLGLHFTAAVLLCAYCRALLLRRWAVTPQQEEQQSPHQGAGRGEGPWTLWTLQLCCVAGAALWACHPVHAEVVGWPSAQVGWSGRSVRSVGQVGPWVGEDD